MPTFIRRCTQALPALLLGLCAWTTAAAQGAALPFTVVSRVMEANTRVVALSIDAGRDLPINWKLDAAFSVSAELMPLKSYAGDPIGNSAAARAPRTIRRAYTSARPEPGSPAQGRHIIIELDPEDFNASSWYVGFNPGIRQLLPYRQNMVYEVRLLHDLNTVTPDAAPGKPGAAAETIRGGTPLRQAGERILTAERFTQGVFEQPGNAQTRAIGYNLYKPDGLAAGARVPLVVFLHGSGQSHDYKAFPDDLRADVLSPLLTNQGGTAWIERAPEKAFVLVPQVPARDTVDAAGEIGWRAADTQKLLLGLVDRVIAENPAIDTRRLYLTGLSLGAMGSWAILTHSDPAIARKFAAAALFNGMPVAASRLSTLPGEDAARRLARFGDDVRGVDYRRVSIPLWLGHADTDPVVPSTGSRVAYEQLTGQSTAAPGAGGSDPVARQFQGRGPQGTEVRYSEYRFGNGDRFRELGMVTRHGHFSWEISYKDQALIDWMFRQQQREPGR